MSEEVHSGHLTSWPYAFNQRLGEFLDAEIGTREELEAHQDNRRRHFNTVYTSLYSRGLIPADTDAEQLRSTVEQYARCTPKVRDNLCYAAYVCVDYSERLEVGREVFNVSTNFSLYQQKCHEALGELLYLSGSRGDKAAWCAAAEDIFGPIHVLLDVEPLSEDWKARISNLEQQHIWRQESQRDQIKHQQRACSEAEAIFSLYGEHDELSSVARACVEAAQLRHKIDTTQCDQAQVRRERALKSAQQLGFDEALVDSVIDTMSQHFSGDYC